MRVRAVTGPAVDPVVPPSSDLDALYRREFPALAGYCLRLLGDEQAARDVAQEAFTRLCGRIARVREPRPWLYMVATNLTRDRWAERERQRLLVGALRRRGLASVAAFDPSVRDAVDRLPARLRLVVVLHYVADLPIAEVAAAADLPVGTVKRRLLEARVALAAALGVDDD